MRTCEIHASVTALLAEPVSASSVKGCLADKVQGPGAPFERVARGRYQLIHSS